MFLKSGFVKLLTCIETGCVIYKNRICQYVNVTGRIIIDHYIEI
jgi:hypothetical protein